MHTALIISSGIGNALLLIPLLKQLKAEDQNKLTLLLTSPFLDKDFLNYINIPADEIIDLTDRSFFSFCMAHFQKFERLYLDLSSSSVKNILYGKIMSKKMRVMRESSIPFLSFPRVLSEKSVHAAILNKKLHNHKKIIRAFNLKEMIIFPHPIKKDDPILNRLGHREKKIIAVQISAGNHKAPYKNWPKEKWVVFLQRIIISFPQFKLVLLGDSNEAITGNQITKDISGDLINLTGKTSLIEATKVLQISQLYIGLDSGLMHLAVALNKATFSIFGASSPTLFAYDQFDSRLHKIIYKSLNCGPCQAMVGANQSRVKHPDDCPDFICINGINPVQVFEDFSVFIQNLNLPA